MDRKIEPKKGLKKKHIVYIIFGIIILSLILWMIFGNKKSKINVNKNFFQTATVIYSNFNDYIRVTGRVQPKTYIQLSPLEGGIVEQILIEEGSMVKKGDVILKLSNPQLALQILESEASLAEKENFLRNTIVTMEQQKLDLEKSNLNLNLEVQRNKRKYEQNKRLFNENLISEEEYIQAKENYELSEQNKVLVLARQKQDSIYRRIQIENMEESLESMRQSMVLIRQRKENLNVKSPIDGQLGSLDVVLGQSINSGTNIGQINQLSEYKIEASIDEHYIDKVFKGLKATFTRQSKVYDLVINKVYPEVKNGTFKTDFVFSSEKPENIRSGQTYYINLELGEPNEALLIPKGSFFQHTGGRWIYVLSDDESKAFKRNIKIGKQNPNYYEVLEGLTKGEKVIISGYDNFGDNEILILK